jgi:hypothetical protein
VRVVLLFVLLATACSNYSSPNTGQALIFTSSPVGPIDVAQSDAPPDGIANEVEQPEIQEVSDTVTPDQGAEDVLDVTLDGQGDTVSVGLADIDSVGSDAQITEDAQAEVATSDSNDIGQKTPDAAIADVTVGDPDSFADVGEPAPDIPWGSNDDVEPYDAGPVNYPTPTSGSTPPSICAPVVTELNLKEEKVGGKVDIIWWIDTSGSMSQEAKYLNQNINSFANYISGAKLDFRMSLIGNGFGICVQPPLGGPGCTDGPNFMHVKQTIGSTNGNQVLISSYAKWQSFLRPDATKNFVAVTDDNSNTTSQWFIDQLQQKDPINFAQSPQVPYGFVYHGIVGYETKSDCPTIAKKGSVYLDLVVKTGGSKFKVCDTNWAPMFVNLAQNVVLTAKPGCNYTIPYPTNALLTSYIGLSYVAKDDLFAVPAAPANVCPSNGVGFTVNDPIAPVEITLCPASCDLLKGGGNLQFDFGCF